jgi:hypothetical protein
MLGRDHALTGALAFAAAAPFFHAGMSLAAGTVLTAGAALLLTVVPPRGKVVLP